MKKVKGCVKTSIIGSECEFEFEVEDYVTDEEIEELAKFAVFDEIEWSYEVEE